MKDQPNTLASTPPAPLAVPAGAGDAEVFTPARVLNRALNRRFGFDEDAPIPWGNMTPKVVYDVALACLQGVEVQMMESEARAEQAATLRTSLDFATNLNLMYEGRGRENWQQRAEQAEARLLQEQEAAAEQERQLLLRDEEARKLRAENTRLLRNAGYGGLADEAPDEIHLCGDPVMGCDAWLHIDRVEMIDGEPAPHWQEAFAAGRATDAVRYVKAPAPAPVESEASQFPGMPTAKCHGCGLPSRVAMCRTPGCPGKVSAPVESEGRAR